MYNSALPPKPELIPGSSCKDLKTSTSPIVGSVDMCFGEKEILPGSFAILKNSLDFPYLSMDNE